MGSRTSWVASVISDPTVTSDRPSLWIETNDMARTLGVHRATLQRLKGRGYFRDGHHFRKKNPLSPRSNLLWHEQRVQMRMRAD